MTTSLHLELKSGLTENNLNYNIIKSKRKTLAVSIDNIGNIFVKAPVRMPQAVIDEFLISKNNWITTKQNQAKINYQKHLKLYDYTQIMFLGEIKKCFFTKTKNIQVLQDNVLIPERYQSADKKRAYLNALKRFFIFEANKLLFEQIKNISQKTGLSFNGFKIINTKTRWGSCDRQGNISINFRAIMLNEVLTDYLIIHELAHNVEFNHSKRFWKIVSTLIPQYKTIRKMLKEYNFLQDLFR